MRLADAMSGPSEHGRPDSGPIPCNAVHDMGVEELRLLLDSWLDAVLVVDSESFRIVYGNESCELILGYSPDELIGVAFDDLFSDQRDGVVDEQAAGMAQAFDKVLGGQEFLRKDGASIHVDVVARMVEFGPDATPHVVIGLRDATERLRLEAERERLLAELREAIQKVQMLEGLLPICAVCKQIRDDEGDWSGVEEYITERTKVHFSHGLCPGCFDDLKKQI